MIEKLKDFWYIFKSSKHEFYKDKNEAIELLERVKYIKDIIFQQFFLIKTNFSVIIIYNKH